MGNTNFLAVAKEENGALQTPTIYTELNKEMFYNFINYIDVNKTTQKNYINHLRQFYVWTVKNGKTQAITRQDIREYKTYLQENKYSAGTQNQYLRAVKQFFNFLHTEYQIPNIAENIKGAKVRNDNTKKEAFTESQIKKVFESVDTSSLKGKRDIAMLLLSVTSGLRTIEIQRADIKDLAIKDHQYYLYIQGKGHIEKDQKVKIAKEAYQAIETYLNYRGSYKNSDPLFADTSTRQLDHNRRLTTQSISRIFKKIFREAGFDSERLTGHSLRHTSNTLLFKTGADLFTVQQHARHADPKTTEIYLHTNEMEKLNTAQDILEQIYNPNENLTNVLISKIKELNHDQQKQLIEIIKTL